MSLEVRFLRMFSICPFPAESNTFLSLLGSFESLFLHDPLSQMNVQDD